VIHAGEVRENVPGVTDFTMLPPVAAVDVKAYVDDVPIANATTTAGGSYAVCVPPDTSVSLAFQKTGFYGQVFLRVTVATELYLDVRLFHENEICPLWTSLGATCPSTTDGFITIATLDSAGTSLAGVSGTIAPVSGSGPFYFDDTFTYDPALMQTSTAGFFALGNLQPGLVTLTLSHASLTCSQEDDGFSAGTNAIRFPVLTGVETSVVVKCQ
jgi:hypothetical protein